MSLVSQTEGAQFTPAGVLRLPLDGMHSPAQLLDALGQRLEQLA
jgi:hypothetical protein